ncbi:MAG: biotin/lipoyl-containing protein [Polyangia bacterium]
MTAEYIVQVGAGAAGATAKRQVQIEPAGPQAGMSPGQPAGQPGDAPAQTSDRFRIVIDGRETWVSARRIEASSYSLISEDGTQVVVDVDGSLPELRVTVAGGEPLRIQIQDARALSVDAGASGGGQSASEMRASMPGKVVKVLCKPGDVIKPGQGLMVIEAMKMENELRALGPGKVAEVLVREGQTVEGGQRLVVFTEA